MATIIRLLINIFISIVNIFTCSESQIEQKITQRENEIRHLRKIMNYKLIIKNHIPFENRVDTD